MMNDQLEQTKEIKSLTEEATNSEVLHEESEDKIIKIEDPEKSSTLQSTEKATKTQK